MEYTMQRSVMRLSVIPGTHVSGLDVSTEPRGWQRKRSCVRALNDFPTNGTSVSAGWRRT
jgi:hypothetical protein